MSRYRVVMVDYNSLGKLGIRDPHALSWGRVLECVVTDLLWKDHRRYYADITWEICGVVDMKRSRGRYWEKNIAINSLGGDHKSYYEMRMFPYCGIRSWEI